MLGNHWKYFMLFLSQAVLHLTLMFPFQDPRTVQRNNGRGGQGPGPQLLLNFSQCWSLRQIWQFLLRRNIQELGKNQCVLIKLKKLFRKKFWISRFLECLREELGGKSFSPFLAWIHCHRFCSWISSQGKIARTSTDTNCSFKSLWMSLLPPSSFLTSPVFLDPYPESRDCLRNDSCWLL